VSIPDAIIDHLFDGLVATGHSGPIVARRNGSVIANEITAIRGRSSTERGTSDYVETISTTDFIVKAADYGSEPEPNDRITSGSKTYKALADSSQRCWDFVDTFETLYRIRTVLE